MYISDLTYLEVATEINEVHGGYYYGWKKKGGDYIDIDVDQYAKAYTGDIKAYKSDVDVEVVASNYSKIEL
jgi:hypothetical protein